MTVLHPPVSRPALLLPADGTRNRPAALAVAGLLAVGGAIHVVAAFDHASEYVPFAVAFSAMAAVQLLAAAAVAGGTMPAPLWRATIALSVAVAVLWATSRLVGLPIGPEPWQPEAVGIEDTLCTISELLAAGLMLRMARPAAPLDHPPGPAAPHGA